MQRLDFTTSTYPTSPILSKKSTLETVSPPENPLSPSPFTRLGKLGCPYSQQVAAGRDRGTLAREGWLLVLVWSVEVFLLLGQAFRGITRDW
jgi:hypothetical protein